MCEFIDLCTNIQEINLDYLGASIVTKAISDRAATLIKLHLSAYCLYPHDHYELASCLRKLVNLKDFRLSFLKGDLRSINEVWKAIAAVPKLARLGLSGSSDIDFDDIAG